MLLSYVQLLNSFLLNIALFDLLFGVDNDLDSNQLFVDWRLLIYVRLDT